MVAGLQWVTQYGRAPHAVNQSEITTPFPRYQYLIAPDVTRGYGRGVQELAQQYLKESLCAKRTDILLLVCTCERPPMH
jgi:hypothetical protein